MYRFRRAALIAAATLPLLPSCAPGAADSPSLPKVEAPADSLNMEELQESDIPNVTTHEGLYSKGLVCAGQISESQMDFLKDKGVRTFVSLRVATEGGAGWEEAYAQGKGINFTRVEIAGAGGITVDAAKRLHATLNEAEGPVVLYCGSSNRVGALLGIAAHHMEGASKEEALKLAQSAGLTKLEPVFREVLGM